MNDSTIEKLESVLVQSAERVEAKIIVESDDVDKAVQSLVQQTDKLIELKKIESEIELEKQKLDLEESKLAETKSSNKRNFWVGLGTGVVVPILLFAGKVLHQNSQTNKVLKYEETGIVTSTPAKSHFSGLFKPF